MDFNWTRMSGIRRTTPDVKRSVKSAIEFVAIVLRVLSKRPFLCQLDRGMPMNSPTSNRFLAVLSPEGQSRILSLCKHVKLPLRTRLQEQDETPEFVYFPTSGIASVVINFQEGGSVEVGLIGKEGLVNGFAMLGASHASTVCFMQVEGDGYRIPFAEMRKIFLDSEEVRSRVLEFVQADALTTNQIAACNKLHEAEARLGRWLLMVRDRIDSNFLPITQEFLGQMLGTRRSTVALVAGSLQRSGLLEYKRGKVILQDPERLREVACDCYPIAERYLRQLYR